jgi:hypothetical protein
MLGAVVRGGDALVRQMGARAQLFVSSVLFGGLMTVAVRYACRGPGGFSAGQVSMVRFAVGVLSCLALFELRPGTYRPVRRDLLVTRGLLGGLAVVFYFMSISRIGAGQDGARRKVWRRCSGRGFAAATRSCGRWAPGVGGSASESTCN